MIWRDQKNLSTLSPDLIDEGIKADLEPLNEQASTLTRVLNQLIQESSARDSSTAGPCTQQTLSRRSPCNEAGTSRALPASAIASTTFPPDSEQRMLVLKKK